jgi:DNA-directed RNA polymerase III subunit RPC1
MTEYQYKDYVNNNVHQGLLTLPNSYISSIQFGMLKGSEVHRLSCVQVINRNLYELNRSEAQSYGCLDRRLGISVKKALCATCNKNLNDCIGHFGHIELELPIFHIGYFKETTRILQMICKKCSRILLSAEEISIFQKRRRANRIDPAKSNSRITEEILSITKKKKLCLYCGSINSTVKKLTGVFKLVHDIKDKDWKSDFHTNFINAVHNNPTLKEYISKAGWDLNPLTVQHLFRRIVDSDLELMNLNKSTGRPEDMIMNELIIPPACIRPSVSMGTSGTNEDDLTVKIGDIVFINNVIKTQIDKGATAANVMENWDFLQQQVAMYINSDLPGFPKNLNAGKPIRALIQRLKGKTGRFRGNLSGKRVDFSSRTVISPDPNLRVDEVGIPLLVAKTLTYPERVNSANINKLRLAVINGPDLHPGANIVEYANGNKTFLKYGNRQLIAQNLRIGDIVERHISNGDIVLFNRQPSLHRLSIMSHRVRVLEWRTFRFNESVCAPYNADFDGDEMNLHVPQTEEARTEAIELMGITKNLITPRHGEPLITATQDFITTAYLITQKDVFYDKYEFSQICCYFTDAEEEILLPAPAIIKPVRLWTGKQIFSLLIKPNSSVHPRLNKAYPIVNIELKERNYEKKDSSPGYHCMDHRDGYVVIRQSELMCGNIAKTSIGGDKSGLLYSLIRDYGSDMAAELLNRLAKLSSRWIGNRGFSIGIDDVTPTQSLNQQKLLMLDKGYKACEDYINQWKSGSLPLRPGCNEEQTLESLCLKELSDIREALGGASLKGLDYNHNSPLIMAVCGSKGSKINISQMISCVGQQAVSGHRIPEGFVNRTLPHFNKFSRDPDAKGFVKNSFFSGLTATEFFCHTMGGREGLVDTAVKTAETGYMQRRLMKALEDLCVQYDGSVRTSEQNIVQFEYGDDGLDPLTMAQAGIPVNFHRLLQSIRAKSPQPNTPSLSPNQLKQLIHQLESAQFAAKFSQSFHSKLLNYCQFYLDELTQLFSLLELDETKLQPTAHRGSSAALHLLNNSSKLTANQFNQFLSECESIYNASRIEAGTAVGAIAAQSIGEPGTQMTLKVIHYSNLFISTPLQQYLLTLLTIVLCFILV